MFFTPQCAKAKVEYMLLILFTSALTLYPQAASRKYSDIGCSPPGHYRDTAHYMHVVLGDEVAIS